jgi:hypothetical protein
LNQIEAIPRLFAPWTSLLQEFPIITALSGSTPSDSSADKNGLGSGFPNPTSPDVTTAEKNPDSPARSSLNL